MPSTLHFFLPDTFAPEPRPHPRPPAVAPARRLQEGCLRFEAQRGIFVSPQHSVLVLDDEAAVAELRQLETSGCAAPVAAELLHRLGAVLRFERALHAVDGAVLDAELVARVARAAQVRRSFIKGAPA